jgi:acetyl-CoA carboxylase biotin carboxyl carrier protein
MKITEIKKLIDLAKESGLAELKYESGDDKVAIKLPYANSGMLIPATAQDMSNSSLGQAKNEKPAEPTSQEQGLIEISSPFVGTFYRSSSPDTDAYVKIGDKISSGKVLCIVEAMKIMNEIESEVSGEIVEICLENETYVEFGQTLFKVRP